MTSRWCAIICACQTRASDIKPMVKAQRASTKPICDSDAGMRRARTIQDMVIITPSTRSASLLTLVREGTSILRNAPCHSFRNRRATCTIPNGLPNPSKTNDLTPLVSHIFLAPTHIVCNSTRQSGTFFLRRLEIMPQMPLGKARLQPLQRLILRCDLR
jgi:hypothetical protein